MRNAVTLYYLGHSCFRLEYGGRSAVIDPYADGSVPGCGKIREAADAVFCSHDHRDHGFADGVILSGDPMPEDMRVYELSCPHDDRGGELRGMNTVRVFDCGGIRVAHLGDIGCFPSPEVLALIHGVDALLIPVGGYYTIDAETAYAVCETAAPRCIIPMHYRAGKRGYDVLDTLQPFASHFPEAQKAYRELKITDCSPAGLIVMEP